MLRRARAIISLLTQTLLKPNLMRALESQRTGVEEREDYTLKSHKITFFRMAGS